MFKQSPSILIVEENSWVPIDRRVWYEATTLRDAGWDVTVICPAARGAHAGKVKLYESTKSPEDLEGIKVYRFSLNFAEKGAVDYFIEYLVAFVSICRLSWKVWRTQGFDIIHFCNPPDIFFPVGLLYRLLGAKFVFDHHDLFPEMVLERFQGVKGWGIYIIARLMEFLTFQSANMVIANNESYKQIAEGRGRKKADRIVVVRNGPRIQDFVPVSPDPSLKRACQYMVCFVGIMGEEDGVLELIEVIRYIVHKMGRRDIMFAMLGDGAVRSQALHQVSAWSLDEFVDMPGMVRDDRLLRQYMSTADVCVSPEPKTRLNVSSTFIKVGEYMAMGKPIVAFDLKETRFTAQGAALYVTPGDIEGFGRAILDLLDDPARRLEMGMIGRNRIRQSLSWEHQKEALLNAYAILYGD